MSLGLGLLCQAVPAGRGCDPLGSGFPWPGDPWDAGLGGDVSPLYIVCIYQ